MADRMSLGFAIPVYNGAPYLGDVLRSILTQSYPVNDVVVVDDGSEDDSASVAAAVGPPVRVVRIAHAGIGAARSHAVSLLGSDVLALVDADDMLADGAIAPRMQVLEDHPEVDIVFGHVRSFTKLIDGRPVPLDEPRVAHVVGGLMVRRIAFERVGPFASGLRVAEGLDWLLRARELGLGELTVPDQVLWRRVHPANNSLAQRRSIGEFPRVLKQSLDRRRTRQG
jgi:glycosyltransferase involved in cell wall biosynthesis